MLRLGASVLATLAALVIVLPPVFRQIEAEWRMNEPDNIAYLQKQRALTVTPPPPKDKPKAQEVAAAAAAEPASAVRGTEKSAKK